MNLSMWFRGQIEAREADLSEPEAIPRLFDEAEKVFGAVSVLINNAAHCDPDTFLPREEFGADGRAVDGFPMASITAQTHDQHFAVNSRAVALMTAVATEPFLSFRRFAELALIKETI